MLKNPGSSKISGLVSKAAALRDLLSAAGLLTSTRQANLKSAIAHGKLAVGCEFALKKLQACQELTDTKDLTSIGKAAAMAKEARDKIISKKISITISLMQALTAVSQFSEPARR